MHYVIKYWWLRHGCIWIWMMYVSVCMVCAERERKGERAIVCKPMINKTGPGTKWQYPLLYPMRRLCFVQGSHDWFGVNSTVLLILSCTVAYQFPRGCWRQVFVGLALKVTWSLYWPSHWAEPWDKQMNYSWVRELQRSIEIYSMKMY